MRLQRGLAWTGPEGIVRYRVDLGLREVLDLGLREVL